jgi:hypothetical protein
MKLYIFLFLKVSQCKFKQKETILELGNPLKIHQIQIWLRCFPLHPLPGLYPELTGDFLTIGQIIFQNFHQFKAFVGLSDCRTIEPSDYRTVGLSDCRIIATAQIRVYYGIPLFVRPSTPRTITSLTCSPFY